MVSDEELEATGLSKVYIDTYRLHHAQNPPSSKEKLATKMGVTPATIKTRLARIRKRLEDPASLPRGLQGAPTMDYSDPEKFAAAVNALSNPAKTVAEAARRAGLNPDVAYKVAKRLDGDLQPLGRALEDVRLEDLTKRFGMMARDAIDAITPEKLNGATAQQLAIIAGIGADKWQLLRGQPTARVEIEDRRKMDEVLTLIMQEAKRRNMEIDVTPEGEVTAKRSPFRSAKHRDLVQAITSGDPPESLTPA